MRPIARCGFSAVLALALGACATMTAGSHVAPAVDLRMFYTYDWGPRDALPAADPRLDNDPYFHDYVLGAIEKQLTAVGLERASGARPADLRVHYHANITTRIDVDRADRERGYSAGDAGAAHVIEYEAGTLVVDVVDARTNQVVWRGWAQDSVDGVLDDADRLRAKVDRAVRRIFEQFHRASLPGER
jgi:uncharacterized protein DUF4136